MHSTRADTPPSRSKFRFSLSSLPYREGPGLNDDLVPSICLTLATSTSCNWTSDLLHRKYCRIGQRAEQRRRQFFSTKLTTTRHVHSPSKRNLWRHPRQPQPFISQLRSLRVSALAYYKHLHNILSIGTSFAIHRYNISSWWTPTSISPSEN
jgi:hypothetical protein